MKKETLWSKGRFIALAMFMLLIAVSIFAVYSSILKRPVLITHNKVKNLAVFRSHTEPLWAVQFGSDGTLLASGGVDSTVKIWRRDSGSVVHNLKHPIGVTTLCYSPDGKWLATGSYDAVVRIWNTEKGNIEKSFNGHKGTVWSVMFSPDGKTIASSGEDRTIKLWNAETGQLTTTINAHSLNIWKVRFTPDGRWLISSSFDQTIKVWDVANGSLLKTLMGHTEAVVGLDVSPDGTLLASGSDDATIKIWDLNSGKLIRTLSNGSGHVYSVAFSPDGKQLVSGSRDKDNLGEAFQNIIGDTDGNKGVSMQIWDVESGQLLETLAEHANDVMDVDYSRDGKWIAGASTDKTVSLWKTGTKD